MNDQFLHEQEQCNRSGNSTCMPWGGVVAGALIAVGLSFLLSIFAAAIGLSAFRTTYAGVTTLAIGGYIGMVIGSIAIMFLSGWVAGYLGRKHCYHQNFGALYGFSAWCVALVIMVILATQTMEFVSANLYSITNHKITTARLYNDSTATEHGYDHTAKSNAEEVNLNDEEATKLLKQSLFLTFALFFIGAISSALGGYFGVKPCKEMNCD